MTQKQKTTISTLPELPAEWLAQLSGHIKTEHDLSNFMGQLMKQLVERSLKTE